MPAPKSISCGPRWPPRWPPTRTPSLRCPPSPAARSTRTSTPPSAAGNRVWASSRTASSGPRCQLLLGMAAPSPLELDPSVNVGNVSRLFPATKPANIARYLPYVEAALGRHRAERPGDGGRRTRHHPRRDRGLRAHRRDALQVQHAARRRAVLAVRPAQGHRQRRAGRWRALPRPRLRAADRQGQLRDLWQAHRHRPGRLP